MESPTRRPDEGGEDGDGAMAPELRVSPEIVALLLKAPPCSARTHANNAAYTPHQHAPSSSKFLQNTQHSCACARRSRS